MRLLFWIALIALLVWLWRCRRPAAGRSDPPPQRVAERMVACARCGVHLPLSESLSDGERHYCCAEHRQAADTDRPD